MLPLGDHRNGADDGNSSDTSGNRGRGNRTEQKRRARERDRNNRAAAPSDAGTSATEADGGFTSIPRVVEYPEHDSPKKVKQSVELISDAYEAIFFLASLLFGSHWALNPELEANELADKTRSFVETLGKKRSKAILDLLDGPLFSFIILLTVLASIAFPRWRKTIQIAKQRADAKNVPIQAQSQAPGQPNRPASTSQSAPQVPYDPRGGIDANLRPINPTDLHDDSAADISPLDR